MTLRTVPTARITSDADELAADLRDRRSFHDGEPCDAFDLCLSCRTKRDMTHVARALVPEQRRAS